MTSDERHSSGNFGMAGGKTVRTGHGGVSYQIPSYGARPKKSEFGRKMVLRALRIRAKKRMKSPRVVRLYSLARRREFVLTGD